MIQIIDSKKMDMTADEHQMYQKIVKSYTTATNRGEDLFSDLFDTDDNGIILFLKPPSKRQTSFEIWLFLMSLMMNQHLRQIYRQVDDVVQQMKDKIREIDEKLETLKEDK